MNDNHRLIATFLAAPPFIPELHKDDCLDTTCVRCEPEPNPIERLDVTAEELERQIAEIRANARKACPDADGAHWEQWHAFLDIDPDLRGRDYTGGTR
ncbi:hypothetical protein ACFUJR_07220 [Streptomyces sp. NPDC057271]|uniref:hypothetical protein n=1 Tax=unclassified Streptomyces TaxID=2593676 RepID=UPI003639825A